MSDKVIEVVVIDDDQDDVHIIADLLKHVRGTSYKVTWISNSQQAVQAIRQQSADVYLIDYHLDHRTGLDILAELEGLDFSKPFILMTGFGDRAVDLAAMEKGASDYLPKEGLTADLLERSIRFSIKQVQDREKLKELQKLRVQKESAEVANQMKSKFLAYMSHEIRSPLSAILGYADMALDPDAKDDEKTSYVQTIKNSSEHLLLLINDLLDLSKVEAGKIETVLENTSWKKIVTDVISLFKPKAALRGVQIFFEPDPNVPELLLTDAQRFRQIVSNLLTNSVKFTSSGYIRIHCKASPVNQGTQAHFVLTVEDTGIGIAPEEQTKLFQPFQQANSSCQRKYGGTGLGLELSQKLARALGGELALTSSIPGTGSIFTLTLPGNFAAVTNEHVDSQRTPLRVLVADDTRENQVIMTALLRKLNCESTVVSNGREAIEQAKENDFDVILMDIEMPEVSGHEATRILRNFGFKKPIVAITAHSSDSFRKTALNSGFTDYMTKPVSKEKLEQVLSTTRSSQNSFAEAPLESTTL